MKLRTVLISAVLGLISLNAWAEKEIVILVNKQNKVEHVSKKELQDFYLGDKDKYSDTKVKAKICMHVPHKEKFFKMIEIDDARIQSNNAKLRTIGADSKILPIKKVNDVGEVINYLTVNQDGGICFLKQEEYAKLTAEQKAALKIVFEEK